MPISVRAGAFREDTRLHNISQEGMCLHLELPVPDNSVLKMQFVWSATKLCTANGHFVWRSDDAAGVFLTESNDEYADFVNLLAAMPEAARAEYWAQVIAPEVRILGTTSGAA